MDWLRDEGEEMLQCSLSCGDSATFQFMSGAYSFEYDEPYASVEYLDAPVSSLWSVKLELTLKVKPIADKQEELSKTYSFTLWHGNLKDKRRVWAAETLEPYCNEEEEFHLQVSLRVVESQGLSCSFTQSAMERFQQSLDGILVVEDQKIAVNKSSLSFDSPFFHALFTGDFKEKESGLFELKDVKYEEIVALMRILCGFQSVTCWNYLILLELSDRYQIHRLRTMCEDYIVGNLDLNCMDERLKFLKLADKYTLSRVQTKVIDSIKNLKEVKTLSTKPVFKKLKSKSQAFILSYCLAKF